MKLGEYIRKTVYGTEITVWDKDYDIEVYFDNYGHDTWAKAMMSFADKLNIVEFGKNGVVVDMYDLIERNIKNPVFKDLFIVVTVDAIMDDMENILAGCVSEEWLKEFAEALEV